MKSGTVGLVILLFLFPLVSYSLEEPNPEEAHLALSKQSLSYTAKDFLERVQENDTHAVKLYLAAGMNPNSSKQTPEGCTALMYAIRNENREIIAALLDKGADVNGTDCTRKTALNSAAAKGMTDVVQMFLEKGAQNASIQDAVVTAASHGRLETLKLLLNNGGDRDRVVTEALKTVSSTSPDITNQQLDEIIRLLRDHNADIEITDDTGLTPLMQAAGKGQPIIVQTLLDAGADINRKCTCTGYLDGGWSALLIAMENNHPDVANILLDYNADSAIKNNRGETALMYAAQQGNSAIAKRILEKGENPDKKDQDGMTALMMAAKAGWPDVVRILIERGASLNEKDERGNTAYKYALDPGIEDEKRTSAMQLLQAAGAK